MPDGSSRGADMRRYRFDEFVVSPRRRLLLRAGAPVPLIPRYFDLLLLLLSRKDEAIDRREIFDCVWADVVVSDGALTQAVRTIRRALGDDPREPRYIRTVSRHGYRFVFENVLVEPDEAVEPRIADRAPAPKPAPGPADEYEILIQRLVAEGSDEDRRDAAERLHALGTAEALRRLAARPGQAGARAILRDARWDVPGAGDVPLLRGPEPARAIAALVALRLRRAARETAGRVLAAAAGGALAGAAAGLIAGVALVGVPASQAGPGLVTALAIIGATAGSVGAIGIGGGLAAAEALARLRRRRALVALGAAGGFVAATLAHIALRSIAIALMGRNASDVTFGSGAEGAIIGAAAGLGYAFGAHAPAGGGLATPRGLARFRAAALTGLACGAAGGLLGFADWGTISVTLDRTADAYEHSQVGLASLARALGEGNPHRITRGLASAFEGLMFGVGLATGLTHRPLPRHSR
jgi:DNA-binding winged helix-turn-helix (wHTH) protein